MKHIVILHVAIPVPISDYIIAILILKSNAEIKVCKRLQRPLHQVDIQRSHGSNSSRQSITNRQPDEKPSRYLPKTIRSNPSESLVNTVHDRCR